ncbi:type IV CRISPR-associated protein Csf1 [Xanthobacter aminoxidans]|uniref:Type IV CRISPR-associated protein Csf1 n=1 Tax=Xanthobacter aminoxidans TaxID=186280 RepID=A0ABW6ZNK7_9HYPH
MIYPSDIALAGGGLSAVGSPWNDASVCACCGKPIAAGDLAVPSPFGPTFTDDLSLAARSGVVCGACAVLLGAGALKLFQKAVVTRDGIFPLAKDAHRAWLFLTPPEPPFVAVVSTTMQQHLIWRTPVTVSKDLLIVRLGQRIMRIRRPVLLAAIEWCEQAGVAFQVAVAAQSAAQAASSAAEVPAGGKRPRKPTKAQQAAELAPPHPFVELDREASSLRHGVIRSDMEAVPEARPYLARLRALNPGELWALASLVKRNRPTPEQPPNIAGTQEEDDQ